ncbi:putative hydroxymethylglutaryl-CoA lyase [Besnoitia besnoiti]|uniref:hydroxymethylglutaryl-CoA lyase n=1 Tax=Besnoitia besnoiti TaxID=94643 RepID=A0A2A9MAM0_BESBE|nr:putative hydroxymethylglutaryl-CoA lyase [Besnoitia besnoiti]PFH35528.1 putative hydroxymethylglutaryl-CoA lyase [Besnoitia besnoiti]
MARLQVGVGTTFRDICGFWFCQLNAAGLPSAGTYYSLRLVIRPLQLLMRRARLSAVAASALADTALSWTPNIREVRIVEVAPRDGLQNEKEILSLEDKINFIKLLEAAGLSTIEIASFVNPSKVPQMADAASLTRHFCSQRTNGVNARPKFQVLVPNMRGFQGAAEAGAREISLFTATTDGFCRANINTTRDESLRRFRVIAREAADRGIKTRGYISCIFECPYEGAVAPTRVVEVARQMLDLGCYEVSLGDTLGSGTAGDTLSLMEELHRTNFPTEALAMHLHDTYGQALTNLLVSIVHGGVRVVDAAAAGLGGCPFASRTTPVPSRADADTGAPRADSGQGYHKSHCIYPRLAPGNVATEDVVYMLENSGIKTGVRLDALMDASAFICTRLHRRSNSKAAAALYIRQERQSRQNPPC